MVYSDEYSSRPISSNSAFCRRVAPSVPEDIFAEPELLFFLNLAAPTASSLACCAASSMPSGSACTHTTDTRRKQMVAIASAADNSACCPESKPHTALWSLCSQPMRCLNLQLPRAVDPHHPGVPGAVEVLIVVADPALGEVTEALRHAVRQANIPASPPAAKIEPASRMQAPRLCRQGSLACDSFQALQNCLIQAASVCVVVVHRPLSSAPERFGAVTDQQNRGGHLARGSGFQSSSMHCPSSRRATVVAHLGLVLVALEDRQR